jgi:hypothetical protein
MSMARTAGLRGASGMTGRGTGQAGQGQKSTFALPHSIIYEHIITHEVSRKDPRIAQIYQIDQQILVRSTYL